MMPKPKKESQFSTPSTIRCCRHCVAPKRHTACWGHCPEYLKEKAEYEERKATYFGDRQVSAGLTAQREKAVAKELRGRRNSFRNIAKRRFDNG